MRDGFPLFSIQPSNHLLQSPFSLFYQDRPVTAKASFDVVQVTRNKRLPSAVLRECSRKLSIRSLGFEGRRAAPSIQRKLASLQTEIVSTYR